MKKMIICLTIAGLLLMTGTALATDPIKLIVNGVETKTDVPPQIVKGRTLVPIRTVAESLNMNVRWDDDTKTVHIATPQSELRTYNSKEDFINELSFAIQGLYEIEYHLTDAFMYDNLYSNTHIERAKGWLATVKRFERNLALYKDTVGMNKEYQQLVQIRQDYTQVVNGIEGKFPRTALTIDYFEEYERLRGDALIDLMELDKSVN